MDGMRLQGLDLTEVEEELLAADPRGAVVLGGRVGERLERHLRRGGALVFPALPQCPVDPYRNRLYTAEELYAGLEDGYEHTLDARCYAWSRDATTRHDVLATMVRAVHDDAVSDALVEVPGRSPAPATSCSPAAARGDGGRQPRCPAGRCARRGKSGAKYHHSTTHPPTPGGAKSSIATLSGGARVRHGRRSVRQLRVQGRTTLQLGNLVARDVRRGASGCRSLVEREYAK